MTEREIVDWDAKEDLDDDFNVNYKVNGSPRTGYNLDTLDSCSDEYVGVGRCDSNAFKNSFRVNKRQRWIREINRDYKGRTFIDSLIHMGDYFD
jgi:hypothetical protein